MELKKDFDNESILMTHNRKNMQRCDITIGKIISDYGDIMPTNFDIISVAITKDSKYLFILSQNKQYQLRLLQKWNIKSGKFQKTFEVQITYYGNWSLLITNNNRFLLNFDGYKLKQWSIKEEKLIKQYEIKPGQPKTETENKTKPDEVQNLLYLMAATSDDQYQFIAGSPHQITLYSLKKQRVEKHFEKMVRGSIISMTITNDNESQFICSDAGNLIIIDIESRQLSKSFGNITQGVILSAISTKDSKYLFTSDSQGYLRQWDLDEKRLYKRYNRTDDSRIQAMCVSIDDRFLFTIDDLGSLKQWDVQSPKLIKESKDVLYSCDYMISAL